MIQKTAYVTVIACFIAQSAGAAHMMSSSLQTRLQNLYQLHPVAAMTAVGAAITIPIFGYAVKTTYGMYESLNEWISTYKYNQRMIAKELDKQKYDFKIKYGESKVRIAIFHETSVNIWHYLSLLAEGSFIEVAKVNDELRFKQFTSDNKDGLIKPIGNILASGSSTLLFKAEDADLLDSIKSVIFAKASPTEF